MTGREASYVIITRAYFHNLHYMIFMCSRGTFYFKMQLVLEKLACIEDQVW